MQHTHVKCKENPMNTISKEAFHIDPHTVAILQARGRRARALAMHSLLLRLLARLTPRIHLRPARWLERLG